jgi:GAF domain-containing protein
MGEGGIEHVAAALESEQTVRGLLDATCRQLVDALGASACAISRVVGDLLVGLVELANGRGPLSLGHEYLISDYPLTFEVVTSGEPRAVSLLEGSPEPNEASLLQKLGYDSLLMLCLPAGGACWGLVEVYANGEEFGENQAGLAREIATHAGRVLERLEPPN